MLESSRVRSTPAVAPSEGKKADTSSSRQSLDSFLSLFRIIPLTLCIISILTLATIGQFHMNAMSASSPWSAASSSVTQGVSASSASSSSSLSSSSSSSFIESTKTILGASKAKQLAILEQGAKESNKAMKRCIDIKRFKISEGKLNQSFPAPTCESWDVEGRAGDIFFPANSPTAMAKFAELNKIIMDSAPVSACKNILGAVPLRNFRKVDGPDPRVVYPAMWGDEMEVAMKTLANWKPKTYYEWGAGGSTRWLTAFASDTVISVDTFKAWCDKVTEDPFVDCLKKQGVFKQYCVDTGTQKIEGFGRLVGGGEEAERLAREFVDSIDTFNIKRYDVILVDGRFRQGCALKALHYVDEDTSIVIIHDFWSRWEKYDFLLQYYRPLGRSRTIGVLKKRPEAELPPDWKYAYKKYATVRYQS